MATTAISFGFHCNIPKNLPLPFHDDGGRVDSFFAVEPLNPP